MVVFTRSTFVSPFGYKKSTYNVFLYLICERCLRFAGIWYPFMLLFTYQIRKRTAVTADKAKIMTIIETVLPEMKINECVLILVEYKSFICIAVLRQSVLM